MRNRISSAAGPLRLRRLAILTSLLVSVPLLAAQSASADPTVTFKAKAVPITGFAHTGNIKGAGAAFQAEFTIKGTEYGGFPPPLIGVNVYLPKGTKLHPSGFKTCPTATLVEAKEPTKCPKQSKAGPLGHAKGFVVFGTERVSEEVTIESFFAPGGGINFFVAGHSPTIIEITSTGKYVNLGGAGGFGPKFVGSVPLIETVPGAADGSTETINVKVGTAMKKGKETIYYGRVPKTCPKGGFPVKAELIFANTALLPQPSPGAVVTAKSKSPCPRH